MSEKILEKIKKLLTDKCFPKNEFQLVYFFVLFRKLFSYEINLSKNKYMKIIKFYADWILHTQLDYYSTEKILKKINSELSNGNFGQSINGHNLITFEDLLDSMSKFIEFLDIKNLFMNRLSVLKFCNSLRTEIINCPLITYKDNKNKSLGIKYCFRFDNLKSDSVDYYYQICEPDIRTIKGTLLFESE